MKMKKILYLLLLILPVQIFAQIANGGFEEWELIDNVEKPVSWATSEQDSLNIRIEKDSSSIEGDYSMKIVPRNLNPWLVNCTIWVSTSVKFETTIGDNKSLTAWVKSIPDSLSFFENVYLEIYLRAYEMGNLDSIYNWKTHDRIDEFMKLEIPITNPNIDSLRISINGGATNSPFDGCDAKSISWVDGIMIEETITTQVNSELFEQRKEVSIYPNPSNGLFFLNHSSNFNFNKFQLFALDGSLVEIGDLNDRELSFKAKLSGLFVLKLMGEKGTDYYEVSKRIIIN